MALEKTTTTPKKSISEISILFHGLSKSGKTALVNEFKTNGRTPYFITTEDNHSHLESCTVKRIKNFLDLGKTITNLEANKEQLLKEHSCIVVDLACDVDELAKDFVLASNNVKKILDIPFGDGFAQHRKHYRTAVRKLQAIMPVHFIAHSELKSFVWQGKEVELYKPMMDKQNMAFLCGKVQAIGFFVPSGLAKGKSVLTFNEGNGVGLAGSHYSGLIRNFEIDHKNLGNTWAELNKAFLTKK
ncbi:AAA family ATPase [Flavobacterium alkalisoli]|uniref:AAA family ATPase n=1 Tax=Flavobacterium alkalisoli TaxID=2602769 RepID=UPI003A9037CD